jgi:hypothetical protein
LIRLPLSDELIKKIVGENPEYTKLHITSKVFKLGYVDLEIPSKLLKVGHIHVTFKIPKKLLTDENKTGKLGSYQIKTKPNGKAKDIPVLRTMLTKFATVDLIAEVES